MLFSALAAAQDAPKKLQPGAKKKQKKQDDVVRVLDSLTPQDPHDKVRPGVFHKVHKVKMSPGKTYVIEMIRRDPSRHMDPYLRVETSKEVRLPGDRGGFLEDDDGAGNLNSRIVFTPTVEDEYRIIAGTLGGGGTGPYLLTVTPVPVGTPVPGMGQPLAVLMPVEIGDIVITPHPVAAPSLGGSNLDTTHGYVEYRFTIENYAEAQGHEVTLTLPRHRGGRMAGAYLQSLRKTVTVEPLGVVEVSLFQPDMQIPNATDAEVAIDGRTQDLAVPMQLAGTRGILLNPHRWSGRMTTSSFMSNILCARELQNALETNVFKSAVGVHDTALPGANSTTSGNYNVVGPYYQKRYVYSFNNRFTMSAAPPLNWSRHWLGYTSFDAVAMTAEQLRTAPLEVQSAIWQYTECGGTLLVIGPCKLPESWQRSRADSKYFKMYYPGFGQCIVAEKYAINQWDPDAWREVTGAWTSGAKAWQQLRGTSQAHREFPVVEDLGIPVRALFLVMILFVVLIGPVNFYWLTQTRRRIWMLWTVPAISIATCAVLFGYMMLKEGWQGSLRADSVTFLDESSQRAATVGWTGYYSPVNVGGLLFSDDTELTPHLVAERYDRNTRPHTINWTNGQHLESGWMDAKVPIHFMVRRNEKRLERLLVRKRDDGALVVVNGLPADIKELRLATLDGKIWQGRGIGAGAEAALQPTGNAVAPGREDALRKGFGDSWLQLSRDIEANMDAYLRPGGYVAVIDGDTPFLEQGMQNPQTRKLRAVVCGILKEPL
jgi:hypothetical protein